VGRSTGGKIAAVTDGDRSIRPPPQRRHLPRWGQDDPDL